MEKLEKSNITRVMKNFLKNVVKKKFFFQQLSKEEVLVKKGFIAVQKNIIDVN